MFVLLWLRPFNKISDLQIFEYYHLIAVHQFPRLFVVKILPLVSNLPVCPGNGLRGFPS